MRGGGAGGETQTVEGMDGMGQGKCVLDGYGTDVTEYASGMYSER